MPRSAGQSAEKQMRKGPATAILKFGTLLFRSVIQPILLVRTSGISSTYDTTAQHIWKLTKRHDLRSKILGKLRPLDADWPKKEMRKLCLCAVTTVT